MKREKGKETPGMKVLKSEAACDFPGTEDQGNRSAQNKRMEHGWLQRDFHPYFISSEKSLMGFKQQLCDKIIP